MGVGWPTMKYKEWQFIDGTVKELIQQCLTVEKSYRPSTMELLDQIHEMLGEKGPLVV